MVKPVKMTLGEAEELAARCLMSLASTPERLGGFLVATGLGPGTLRAAARDRQFLAAVITYVNEDEQLLLDCAAELGVAPETLARCYDALVGPAYFEEP